MVRENGAPHFPKRKIEILFKFYFELPIYAMRGKLTERRGEL
jgi:hypothetical protein